MRVARLHIDIATDEAAKTAVLFGGVAQAVAYLAALLDATGTLRAPAKSDVDVRADFLSDSPRFDIEIGLSLRVWQIFDLIFRSAGRAIRELMRG